MRNNKKALRLSYETVHVLSDDAVGAVAGGGGPSAMSGSWMAQAGHGDPIKIPGWVKPAAWIGVGVATKAAYDRFFHEKK